MKRSAILVLVGIFLFAAPTAYGTSSQDATSAGSADVSALAAKTYNSAEGFDPTDGIYVKAQKDLYWQGRYSNDRVFAEYLAKELTGRFDNLENYAVGGAFSGILTGSIAAGNDRSNWSSWLKGWGGVEQTTRFVDDHSGVATSSGLYVISTGGNDEYAASTLGYTGAADASVACIEEMVTNLAAAGATDFVIMMQTTKPGRTESTFTGLHRAKLSSWFATYAPAHPALEIVLLDANDLYVDMTSMGLTAYGFMTWGFSLISDWVPAYGYAYAKDDNTNKLPTNTAEDIYQYGYYYSNVVSPANPYYTPSVSSYDVDDFLYYDEYHLSGRTQKHLASYILDTNLDVGGGSTFAKIYSATPSTFAASPLSGRTYTKIYTFGDSSIDSGKANEITTALVNARAKVTTGAPVDIKNATLETTISNKVWTGKLITPNPALKYNGKALVKDTDYTASYKANKSIGKATITIKGIGKYTGAKTVTFKIIPKKSSVKKLTPKKKSLIVTWNKVSAAQKVTKYQIRYRISGKAWKTKTVAAKTKSVTIKKLKKGKKYQVQVRSYKTVSGKKYYSAWSKIKTSKKVK